MTLNKKGNSAMPMLIGAVVVLIIAAGAYVLLMNPGQENQETTPTLTDTSPMPDTTQQMPAEDVSENETTETDMESESDVVEVVVTGGNFYFEPSMIEAKVGQTVRVVFENVEGYHDFVIDEFDTATSQITEGETETIEFVVDQTGEFEYYCSVGNHREQGMVGTLVVTE